MHINTTLNIVSAYTETISTVELRGSSKLPISFAQAKVLHLNQGKIIKQSFGNYFANFDLFEISMEQTETVRYELKEPGIFIFLVLKGNSVFSGQQCYVMPEQTKHYTYSCYIPKGSYDQVLTPGEYKTLVMTIKPEWFIMQSENLIGFNQLAESYITSKTTAFSLPNCTLDRDILRPFKRLQLLNAQNGIKLDVAMDTFLNLVIHSYHHKLQNQMYTSGTLKQLQAERIKKFIKDNFTQKVVEDIPQMASIFCMSEKKLHRLAKTAFGVPLHEQVIRYRMLQSKNLILTTNKPIYKIAELIGYNDSYYFSKAFKRCYKITPSEFRHQLGSTIKIDFSVKNSPKMANNCL